MGDLPEDTTSEQGGGTATVTTAAPTGDIVTTVVPSRTRRRRWLGTSRKLQVGTGIVACFVLVALIGPFFVGDANAFAGPQLQAPSSAHWLGTTNTGQDVLSQLVVGARGSLLIGALSGVLSTVIAFLVGVTGGYLGGLGDEILSLVSNVFLVIPGIPLLILVTDYVHRTGPLVISLTIGLTSWAGGSRVLRAQSLSLRQRDFVDAARVSGEPGWRIIGWQILPNLLPILASGFLFGMIGGILTEAGLTFIGLGDLNSVTWGTMLYFAQNGQALSLGAWWWFVPPGLCIAVIGAALSLVNFGIDERVNPRLRVPGRRNRKVVRR
ncbi:ABC transporter permease [Streptomyces sp. CA-111067]|uniref:ABC transporter permease n=1 Tax=Streptomyces sp. CA-111067 TaxID=3240046 RepID=UPI003D99EBCF